MVNHSSNLLFPTVPLTHFRAMYCKGIRMACMNSLIRWNEKRLEHLELIDENYDWMEYMSQAEEMEGDQFLDPFIYAAWRCPNLRTIKIGRLTQCNNESGISKQRHLTILLQFSLNRVLILWAQSGRYRKAEGSQPVKLANCKIASCLPQHESTVSGNYFKTTSKEKK